MLISLLSENIIQLYVKLFKINPIQRWLIQYTTNINIYNYKIVIQLNKIIFITKIQKKIHLKKDTFNEYMD